MKCPECGCKLLVYDTESKYRCCSCKFRIRSQRFDEIVNDLYKPKFQRAIIEDNQEALNNL